MVTYHPVTLEKESPKETFRAILDVLDELKDTNLIFTHANSDKNGRIINEMIGQYVQSNKHKAIEIPSLGQLRYLSALQWVDCVVGNSSSGIVEVPMFNIPTINIGDRQKGRISPQSVIHCDNSLESIEKSVYLALSVDFQQVIKNQEQLYGEGNTAESIIKVLKKYTNLSLKKSFYDIEFTIK